MTSNVAVIGLGFIGLSLALFLGTKNVKVTGIDSNKKILKKLQNGEPTFFEPNLKHYLKKSLNSGLTFDSEINKKTLSNDFIFITVGTPLDTKGRINLQYVKSVTKSLSEHLPNSKNILTIVVKSSVIPGTAMQILKPILEKSAKESLDFDLLTNPEFLREGSAMKDTISPHAIIIGGSNKKSIKKLVKFYESVYSKKQQYIETNNITAEMIKYATNAFLATKISFINSIANICQRVKGTNVDDVAVAMGLDPRISKLFLKAGPGYGGSCFPKDLQALISFSNDIGYDPLLLNAVRDINEFQINAIMNLIKKNIGSLNNKKIGILGLSFKENTDDIRESVSIKLIKKLLQKNCKILAHDPKAIENTFRIFKNSITYCNNVTDVFNKTNCVVLLTPWDEYKKLGNTDVSKMSTPFIIDTRRILKISDKNINYVAHGIGQ